jgi:hypothetical protein
MQTEELRAIQAPLKERYRQNPDAAVVTLHARGELGDGVSCRVHTGRALAIAGLHPATGGDGSTLCSGDMILEALAACAGVTLRALAAALEIPMQGNVLVEGDLDSAARSLLTDQYRSDFGRSDCASSLTPARTRRRSRS